MSFRRGAESYDAVGRERMCRMAPSPFYGMTVRAIKFNSMHKTASGVTNFRIFVPIMKSGPRARAPKLKFQLAESYFWQAVKATEQKQKKFAGLEQRTKTRGESLWAISGEVISRSKRLTEHNSRSVASI